MHVFSTCCHLRDIRSRNMHDLDLDLDFRNGPMSNVNRPIDRDYNSYYLMTMAVFAMCRRLRYSRS